MGTYATTTSINTMMIGVTFDTATTSLVSKCITWSENEVNKYVGRRYDVGAFVSSGTIPPLVTSLTEQLAEGYSWRQMSRGSKESLARAAAMITSVIDNLKLIADYKLDLLDSSGDAITERYVASRVKSNTQDYTETFAEDDPLNWTVDSDKITDVEDSRD